MLMGKQKLEPGFSLLIVIANIQNKTRTDSMKRIAKKSSNYPTKVMLCMLLKYPLINYYRLGSLILKIVLTSL